MSFFSRLLLVELVAAIKSDRAFLNTRCIVSSRVSSSIIGTKIWFRVYSFPKSCFFYTSEK